MKLDIRKLFNLFIKQEKRQQKDNIIKALKFGKRDSSKSRKKSGKGNKQLNNLNNSFKLLFDIYCKECYCNKYIINNYWFKYPQKANSI